MASTRRGLGKGLGDLGIDELLGEIGSTATAVTTENKTALPSSLQSLAVDIIKSGRYQPRRIMDQQGLEELANSIRAQGVIQPVIVRRLDNNTYELIAGERRWRAAQLAGLNQVPAVIRNVTDEAALAMSLIENIQRRDLNVIEEAQALQRLINEFKLTHQAVSEAVGKSRTVVTNYLRLLKLNPDVCQLVEKGHLDMGHARALLALEGTLQSQVANNVVARTLSVRETEQMIRKVLMSANEDGVNAKPILDSRLRDIQDNLGKHLGAKVLVRQNAKGRGKLIIHYKNEDELDHLLEQIS